MAETAKRGPGRPRKSGEATSTTKRARSKTGGTTTRQASTGGRRSMMRKDMTALEHLEAAALQLRQITGAPVRRAAPRKPRTKAATAQQQTSQSA